MKFELPEGGDILWPKYVGAVNPTIIDEHCSMTWKRATWYRPWVVTFTPQFPDEVYPILLILWTLFMKPVVGMIWRNSRLEGRVSRRFITESTRACHWCLSSRKFILSSSDHPSNTSWQIQTMQLFIIYFSPTYCQFSLLGSGTPLSTLF